MTNTIERSSVIRLCMYVCVCVHAHLHTCMYSQARMHAQCWCGMCEKSVQKGKNCI